MENLALIESFSEFKDEKLIDRVTLMVILEDVFRNTLKRKFGSDENFDIIINPDKGDLEIWRNRVVVDNGMVEDPNQEIELKDAQKIDNSLNKYIDCLESGKSVRSLSLNKEDSETIADLHLLTSKPILYVCNVDENAIRSSNPYVDAVKSSIEHEDAEILLIATSIESEISQLDDLEEQQLFLEEMGLEKPGIYHLIQSTYKLLNLRTYFTAGKKEVRAWTISKGSTAPNAAGVIHTDFENGFIKAEVIRYNDFISHGSELKCKEAGKLSIEGKEYIVNDGDIMHFRFNV